MRRAESPPMAERESGVGSPVTQRSHLVDSHPTKEELQSRLSLLARPYADSPPTPATPPIITSTITLSTTTGINEISITKNARHVDV